jgi:hypothetical protein
MVCSLTSTCGEQGNRGIAGKGRFGLSLLALGVALPAWVAVKGTSTSMGLIFEDGSDVY